MKLSIIVVNNNLGKLLRQSLSFLLTASQAIKTEIIVVDDASTDQSAQMLESNFPDIQLIKNTTREGFTRSANKALRNATGEYMLVVAPNIISSNDTLSKVLSFMDAHPQAGGLSVRMLNADGSFLPESKDGLPSAWIKFFRFSGLSRLFTKSRLFSHYYHTGWSEEFETAEMDVLSNCFMLLRRSVLVKTGFFDERFPVYGQNIDLSYRIRLAGFKNFYFAKSFVIQHQVNQLHKFSWTYIKHFYGAMLMFAVKYLFKLPEIKLPGLSRWTTPAYELEK